jgi:hypothetical protein
MIFKQGTSPECDRRHRRRIGHQTDVKVRWPDNSAPPCVIRDPQCAGEDRDRRFSGGTNANTDWMTKTELLATDSARMAITRRGAAHNQRGTC